jgi:hypothetical protein
VDPSDTPVRRVLSTNSSPFLLSQESMGTFARKQGDSFIASGHREGETPVPISNTAVKPFVADGTAFARLWESK